VTAVKSPLLAIALVLLSTAAAAQAPLDGRTILTVRVSGLKNIDEAVVRAQIESAPGRPYRRATADRDRVRLDRLGVFSEISVTAQALDDGVQVDVALTETLRILPAVSIAVTDENGASAGPAVKMLSIAGRPQEMSATTRFGGETLFEFNEASAPLRDRRLWHSVKLAGRDRFNKLDEFDERSLDSGCAHWPSRIRRVEERRDCPGLSRRQRPGRHHPFPGQSRHVRKLRRHRRIRQPRFMAGAGTRLVEFR
jgi:hypothetical protein